MPRFLPIDRFNTLREARAAQDADTLLFLSELDEILRGPYESRSRDVDLALATFVALYFSDDGYADAYVRNRYGSSPVDSLLSSVNSTLKSLYSDYESDTLRAFGKYAQDIYLHACYEEQLSMGKWESVRTLTERELSQLTNPEWFDGRRFSDRLWADKDALYRNLRSTLVRGISTGMGLKEMSAEFSKRMEAGLAAVRRLVRTEFNRLQNQALMRSYSDNGVERYEYVAILDERTTETCESMDGMVFAVKDAEPGVNMPPMHPNCRSSTIPVWDGKLRVEGDFQRLDYETWYGEYVK